MKVSRTCPVCKDPYMAREADLKRGWAKTCSKSCAAIARTQRESKGNFKRASASARYSTRNDPRQLEAEQEMGWQDHKYL